MSVTIATSPGLETGEAHAARRKPIPEPELPAWMGVRGFVDIHFHLLWGMDDGPEQASVSLRMGELAYQQGTRAIIATPHCSARYRYDPGATAARVADRGRLRRSGGVRRL